MKIEVMARRYDTARDEMFWLKHGHLGKWVGSDYVKIVKLVKLVTVVKLVTITLGTQTLICLLCSSGVQAKKMKLSDGQMNGQGDSRSRMKILHTVVVIQSE